MPPSIGYLDIPSTEEKECDSEYSDLTSDYAYVPTEGTVDGVINPDLGYIVFQSPCESTGDGDVPDEQPTSEESLRESLKKQLEFCFSR